MYIYMIKLVISSQNQQTSSYINHLQQGFFYERVFVRVLA